MAPSSFILLSTGLPTWYKHELDLEPIRGTSLPNSDHNLWKIDTRDSRCKRSFIVFVGCFYYDPQRQIFSNWYTIVAIVVAVRRAIFSSLSKKTAISTLSVGPVGRNRTRNFRSKVRCSKQNEPFLVQDSNNWKLEKIWQNRLPSVNDGSSNVDNEWLQRQL